MTPYVATTEAIVQIATTY